MAASYDDQGNYIYPEGFDPEANDWLPGYEKQREEWERQYAEAHSRWEAHRKQIDKAQQEDAAARGEEAAAPASYASPPPASEGTLATDEALAALREKLTGGS
jgi:small subunit ribosomal protein S1